ncbi:MAG: serine hydrolase domain-containing protein [Acidimicrobiales bacterium]
MNGLPERPASLAAWQDPPGNRWAFQHVRELIPTARIRRTPGAVWELPRSERPLDAVTFEWDGRRETVGELIGRTQTDGWLVLHGGRIVDERYANGMEEDTPHLLQSVSKSITAAVVGALGGVGLLRPENLLTEVVPYLKGTSFDGATVQHLLDMRAGTRFDENYDDLDADVRVFEEVFLWRPRTRPDLPTDAREYYATLGNDGPHGGPFRYRSVLTDLLGWVVEQAAGVPFHEAVHRHLWAPMGAEFDAEVTVDAHGNAMADGGVCVTLRDLGRFGLLYLRDGRRGDRQVVPAACVADTIRGAPDGAEAFAAGDDTDGMPPGSHYRNCWWVRDATAGYLHGSGIYGQNVFVHRPTDTVVAKLSTWPTPLDRDAVGATAAAVEAIGAHLAG